MFRHLQLKHITDHKSNHRHLLEILRTRVQSVAMPREAQLVLLAGESNPVQCFPSVLCCSDASRAQPEAKQSVFLNIQMILGHLDWRFAVCFRRKRLNLGLENIVHEHLGNEPRRQH